MQDSPALEQRLIDALVRLRHAGPEPETPFERVGLTLSQYSYLETLDLHPGITLRELAALLRVAPPSASIAVRKLESAGYVTRAAARDDARRISLAPSTAGRALLYQARAFKTAKARLILSRLGQDEAAILVTLLERALDMEE